jgi:rhamnosyltransferase
MTKSHQTIFAVVITYFPEDEHILNIIETAKQVDKVVVVDNGSGVEIETKLYKLTIKNSNIEIIKLGDNLGIDKATNIGIKSNENNYDFVMTLDQDSVLGENMVSIMLDWYNKFENKEKVGEITPLIVNPTEVAPHGDGEYQLNTLPMASGKMISIDVIKKIGYQDEIFFIGAVDWDFTCKLKLYGYLSVQVNKAQLLHNLGDQSYHNFLRKTIIYTSHNKIRKYYGTRNSLYFIQRYLFKFPNICLTVIIGMIKTEIKMLIYDKERWIKIKYIFWGITDFILRKTGKINFI